MAINEVVDFIMEVDFVIPVDFIMEEFRRVGISIPGSRFEFPKLSSFGPFRLFLAKIAITIAAMINKSTDAETTPAINATGAPSLFCKLN